MAMHCGRPSSVLPISTSFMRSDSAASFFHQAVELRVSGEMVIVADIEAERFLGRGDLARRLGLRARRQCECN